MSYYIAHVLPAVRVSDLEQFFRPFVPPNILKDYVELFSGFHILAFCQLLEEDIADFVRYAEWKLPLAHPKSKIVLKDVKWMLYAACTASRGINLHVTRHG